MPVRVRSGPNNGPVSSTGQTSTSHFCKKQGEKAMKVTGYKLREAIRRFELQRDTTVNLFKNALHVFEGEVKVNPLALMEQFRNAELTVATLQEAQQRYNLKVTVDVQGKKTTLAAAVKLLGGAGRAAKMWRDAVSEKNDRYEYRNNLERSKENEVAKRVVAYDAALKEANKADAYAGALRAAIATGNATEIESEGLEPLLFE